MADSNVISYPFSPGQDIDPDQVLRGAIGNTKTVLILGYADDGALFVAGSTADKARLNYLVDRFKHKLLNGDFDAK